MATSGAEVINYRFRTLDFAALKNSSAAADGKIKLGEI